MKYKYTIYIYIYIYIYISCITVKTCIYEEHCQFIGSMYKETWLLFWLVISSYKLLKIHLKSVLFLSLVIKLQRVSKFLIKPESIF